MAQFLFITDLDNTLVGDDEALSSLNQQLQEHRDRHRTRIVYATGRSLTLYRELQSEKPLLKPDALITGVGTAIYYDDEGTTTDTEWSVILQQGWNREIVTSITAHYADLTPQPSYEQGPFKVSFYLSESAAVNVLPRLKQQLTERGINANLIYSGGHDLDILPIAANKGAAIQFLRKQWQMNGDRTVTCGDSGNDLAMLALEDVHGIIVGNAKTELLEWHNSNPSSKRYLAKATCAGGILEGLRHFGFFTV